MEVVLECLYMDLTGASRTLMVSTRLKGNKKKVVDTGLLLKKITAFSMVHMLEWPDVEKELPEPTIIVRLIRVWLISMAYLCYASILNGAIMRSNRQNT